MMCRPQLSGIMQEGDEDQDQDQRKDSGSLTSIPQAQCTHHVESPGTQILADI